MAAPVRTIFAQPSADEAAAQLARVAGQLEERFPDAAAMLENAAAGIFPNRGSIIRLVGSALLRTDRRLSE